MMPLTFGGLWHPGWLLVYFERFGFMLHMPWSRHPKPEKAQFNALGFALHWFKKPEAQP